VIVEAIPTQLELSGPSAVNAGACAGPLTLSLRSNAGVLAYLFEDINVSISGMQSASFFRDAACTDPVQSSLLAIPAQTTSISLYFRSPTAGSFSITLAAQEGIEADTFSIQALSPSVSPTPSA
jgi:hypothetical protein